MAVYVTGANGKLGQEVLKLIPSAVPLVRKSSGRPNEKFVDFSDEAGLKAALSDCDTMIHLAGSMKFYDAKQMRESNLELTKRLLACLPKKARVIYASSVSVYGKSLSGIADEKTPPNPDSEYSKSKYEAEKLVMVRPQSIALRIAAIYGSEYEEYSKFLRMIKKGRMVIFGDGKNSVPFVQVSDVAQAIANSINAEPGIYLISGEPITQNEIYAIAANAIGARPPSLRIPLSIALSFAHLLEIFAAISGKKPMITREHISILGRNRVFNCEKAKKGLGFSPRPIEQGIRELASSL